MRSIDRAPDGTLWACSEEGLCQSSDGGKHWDLVAREELLVDVHAFQDGTGALVGKHADFLAWRRVRGSFAPVPMPDTDEPEFLYVAWREGALWIAAGEAATTEEARRKLHTSDTVGVGPGLVASLYGSGDDGRTWSLIDRYKGAVVHALYLEPDGRLSCCMSDATVRQGRIDHESGQMVAAFETVSEPARGAETQWAAWIALPEPQLGWIGSQMYRRPAVLYRSNDGGRAWELIKRGEQPIIRVFRLGGGACVRIAAMRGTGGRIEVWRDGAFREVRRFGDSVSEARVDAAGRLLVWLASDEVWSYSADAVQWQKVAHVLPPW